MLFRKKTFISLQNIAHWKATKQMRRRHIFGSCFCINQGNSAEIKRIGSEECDTMIHVKYASTVNPGVHTRSNCLNVNFLKH